MATRTDDQALTKAQLRNVVRTGQEIGGVGPMRALALLSRRPRRDAADVFLEVVADRHQQPRYRHMATMGLYELGGRRADRALAEAAQHTDERSAAVVALGIGRVGNANRMALVEELTSASAAHLKAQADFAATLLAYRHSLDGHDVKAPTSRQLQELGRRKANPIEIAKATPRQAELAAKALDDQPLDVKLTASNAQRIECAPNSFVWMWSERAIEAGSAPDKGVAGVLFRKSRFENSYALSAIGLATPRRAGVTLTLHRADSGKVMYAGSIAADGSLQLRARNHPGVAAVDVKVNLEGGRVKVARAKSASVVREAKTPKPA